MKKEAQYKQPRLSQTTKTALIIWVPIVTLALIYAGAFAYAKTAERRWTTGYQKCQADYNSGRTGGYACFNAKTEVSKGPLWLPVFKVNGQVSSGKY